MALLEPFSHASFQKSSPCYIAISACETDNELIIFIHFLISQLAKQTISKGATKNSFCWMNDPLILSWFGKREIAILILTKIFIKREIAIIDFDKIFIEREIAILLCSTKYVTNS